MQQLKIMKTDCKTLPTTKKKEPKIFFIKKTKTVTFLKLFILSKT